MKTPQTAAARKMRQQRQHRSRPIPKWLLSSSELEATARSRCLMVLSVLSGETPVTDAIVEAKISRNTYYQLETRALQAMLAALNPRSSDSGRATEGATANSRIVQLRRQVQRLEQEKRRLKRLLLLTHKSVCEPVPHRSPRPKVPWTKATRSRHGRGPSCFTRSTTSPPPSDAPSSTPPGAPSP